MVDEPSAAFNVPVLPQALQVFASVRKNPSLQTAAVIVAAVL